MSKYKKFWGIFFSLLFLWLALRNINFQAIPEAVASINPIYFVLLILSYTLEMITRTFRWLIIQPEEKITFKYSFNGLLLTFFFNNILPARAGEFFRPFYFAKKGLADSGKTLGAVVLERFFDGIMLLGLILISLQTFSQNDMLRKASIITAVFYTLILIMILLAIFKRNIFEMITQKIFSILPKKLSEFLHNLVSKFIDGLNTVKDVKRLIKILIWSVLSWASSVLTMWICFKAFGFEENIIQASIVLTVLSISSMIPASPGTLGVYEFFCIFTLTEILGHSPEQSTTFAIIMHGTQYLYTIVIGFALTISEGIKISEFSPQTVSDTQKIED